MSGFVAFLVSIVSEVSGKCNIKKDSWHSANDHFKQKTIDPGGSAFDTAP